MKKFYAAICIVLMIIALIANEPARAAGDLPSADYSGHSTFWKFTSQSNPPHLVSPVQADSVKSLRPEFIWSSDASATEYKLQISRTVDFSQILLNLTTVSEHYAPTVDLPARSTLYWRVRMKNSDGYTGWSEVHSFTTPNPPGIAALVSPAINALIRHYRPTFDWRDSVLPKSSAPFGFYEIQLAQNREFSSIVIDEFTAQGVILDSDFVPVADLLPNTKYYWRVRAFNGNGEHGSWSAVRYFRTAILAPVLTAPTNAALLDNQRPTLDWEDVAGATSYKLVISRSATFSVPVRTISTINSFHVSTSNLPANSRLYWRVQAAGPNGPSSWSETGSFTTGNPPGVPALRSPASAGLVKDLTPLFNWSNSSLPVKTTFTHYNIQVDDDRDFSSPQINEFTESAVLTDSDYAVADTAALMTGTHYYWRVQAVNTFNGIDQFSAWSPIWSFRTAASSSPTSTLTSVPSCTATNTLTQPPAITFTSTHTPSFTVTSTLLPTGTATCPTSTTTFTPTAIPTFTPTHTPTGTLTYTPIHTVTPTLTPIDTPTYTLTSPPTGMPTITPTKAPVSTLTCANPGGIGILGDSNSDEYRADDARGGEYGLTTLNWMEQLVKDRGIDFGAWGVWGEPRRTGHEYNWARSGATAHTMITGGQVPGLEQQVMQGKISYVLIWIGGNDFHLKNGPYAEIYDGTLSGAALESKLDGIVNDIHTSIDTIRAAGNVSIAIVTIADQGRSAQAQLLYPDPLKRQRVTDAVNSVNARISELAVTHGVVVIDSSSAEQSIFANVDEQGYLHFGGELIYTLEQGNDPYHLRLDDNIGHAGTVLSGMFANSVFVDYFNTEFGLCIPPLTDEEILRNAGIR